MLNNREVARAARTEAEVTLAIQKTVDRETFDEFIKLTAARGVAVEKVVGDLVKAAVAFMSERGMSQSEMADYIMRTAKRHGVFVSVWQDEDGQRPDDFEDRLTEYGNELIEVNQAINS